MPESPDTWKWGCSNLTYSSWSCGSHPTNRNLFWNAHSIESKIGVSTIQINPAMMDLTTDSDGPIHMTKKCTFMHIHSPLLITSILRSESKNDRITLRYIPLFISLLLRLLIGLSPTLPTTLTVIKIVSDTYWKTMNWIVFLRVGYS